MVVYAADCVSACRGTGMASRSLQSLPSTTTISTTIATTTSTTTTTTTTTRGSVCVASSSSHHLHHHHHHHHHQQQQQQQQQRATKLQVLHHHHQPVRQQDYHYPRNHHQVHQPHHIHPSDIQLYTPQQVRQLQEEQQQVGASNINSTTTSNLAKLNQLYPTRIALPDGEERSFIPSVSRRSKDKASELKRECIKPPANKTLFDLQCCRTHHLSSIPAQMTGTPLPPDPNFACTCNVAPATSPSQMCAAPHHIHHHHTSTTSLSGPPIPSTSPPSATSVRQRSRKHRDARATETRACGDIRNPNASPQPTRKPKNILNYMANLTSSPKNRKESSPRKSPQNSSTSSCCSDSCSSSSCSITNNCCTGNRHKSSASKIEGREKSSLLIPSVAENSQCYSTSSPIPSQGMSGKDVSILINTVVPSNEELTATLPCPSGPSSVADVTLLPCYPSSSGQTHEVAASSSIPLQQEPIHYQLQHYQLPQYIQAEYQQDSSNSVSAMSPSQHYDQSDDRLHDPLTSSLSSSPPLSPLSSSPTNESSIKFQSFGETSSRVQCPLKVNVRDTHHIDVIARICTPIELDERVHSPDLGDRIHSNLECRINSPDDLNERINSSTCFNDEATSPSAISDSISMPLTCRSISPSETLPRNTMCGKLQSGRQRVEISGTATFNRRTSPRDSRISRPVSLVSDPLTTGVPSQPLPSYREVLLHPDHYRITQVDNENNSSASFCSQEREPLLPDSSQTSTSISDSTIPLNPAEEDENGRASSPPADLHREGNFPTGKQERVQPVNTNSSVTALYGSCYEKEVI